YSSVTRSSSRSSNIGGRPSQSQQCRYLTAIRPLVPAAGRTPGSPVSEAGPGLLRGYNGSFTVANSVVNGINPIPNQTTGGEGPVTGEEVRIDVTLTTPFSLPADHYFFVPQVQLSSGTFLWLSAAGPTL